MSGQGIPGPQDVSGSNWTPYAMGGLGTALALAGRTGSPASQLGTGLLGNLTQYYLMSALSEPERQRQQKLQDEARQWEVFRTMAGQEGFTTTPQAGQEPFMRTNVAGRDLALYQTKPLDVAGLATNYETQYPGITKGIQWTGNPRTDLALWQAVMPERIKQRQGEALGKRLEALGQPELSPDVLPAPSGTPGYGVGEEAASGTVRPSATRPTIDPKMAAIFGEMARGGHNIPWQELMGAVQSGKDPLEQLSEIQSRIGKGSNISATVPLGVGPRAGSISVHPPSPTEARTAEAAAAIRTSAQAALASPEYKAALAKVTPQQAFAADQAMRLAAQTGDANAYTSALNAINPQIQPLTTDQVLADALSKDPTAKRLFIEQRTGGKVDINGALKQIDRLAGEALTTTAPHRTDESGRIVEVSPRRAEMEAAQAGWWGQLLRDYPEKYGEQAIHEMSRLLRWTPDQRNQALREFAQTHPELVRKGR